MRNSRFTSPTAHSLYAWFSGVAIRSLSTRFQETWLIRGMRGSQGGEFRIAHSSDIARWSPATARSVAAWFSVPDGSLVRYAVSRNVTRSGGSLHQSHRLTLILRRIRTARFVRQIRGVHRGGSLGCSAVVPDRRLAQSFRRPLLSRLVLL